MDAERLYFMAPKATFAEEVAINVEVGKEKEAKAKELTKYVEGTEYAVWDNGGHFRGWVFKDDTPPNKTTWSKGPRYEAADGNMRQVYEPNARSNLTRFIGKEVHGLYMPSASDAVLEALGLRGYSILHWDGTHEYICWPVVQKAGGQWVVSVPVGKDEDSEDNRAKIRSLIGDRMKEVKKWEVLKFFDDLKAAREKESA